LANRLKRRLVLSLSLAVYFFDEVRRRCRQLFGLQTAGSCVVLEYHSIPPEHRAGFAKQLDLLRRIAIPLRTDSREALTPSRWHVAITFDDGLTSFAENAVPELEARGVPATVFVLAERLGTFPSWTSYSPGAMPAERLLTAEELRALPASVLVGSHGSTHAKLTELSGPEARREIVESRRRLEEILGRCVALFSFPYGAFADHLIAYCAEAGYDRIFTNLPALALSDPEEFVTGRIEVKPTDSLLEFRLKIAGSYRWLPVAYRVKRGLVKVLSKRPAPIESNRQEVRLRLPR
jgi:peptidoglycan/xylan/chitin deacetylase (PgdA/CDA1 family)